MTMDGFIPVTGLLILWTLFYTDQKQLKFITSPAKITGTPDAKNKGMILQDTFKKHSSENQYLLLHIPDGDQKVGFQFSIIIYAKPKLSKNKSENMIITFLVKQEFFYFVEAAVINGKKLLLHQNRTSDCTVVGIPVLRPQGSTYSLEIKSYLGKKMKALTLKVPSVYWYLNKKSNIIIDKANSKTNDKRFPGLKFNMGLDTSVDQVMSHIIFPDVTRIVGNSVGVSFRVILKVNPKTAVDFDVILQIKLAGSNSKESNVPGDKESKVSLEDQKKLIKEKMGQFSDKVSVVAARMKNISPEEVNDNMMIIAGGVGGIFVLLIIIVICCCKSKPKEKLKDEEKSAKDKSSGEKQQTEKKPENQKDPGEKIMTEEQRKREKFLQERALRERALRERSRKRSAPEKSSREKSSQEQPSREKSSIERQSRRRQSRERRKHKEDSDDERDKRKQKAKKKSETKKKKKKGKKKKKDKKKKKKKGKKKKKVDEDEEEEEGDDEDNDNNEENGDDEEEEENDGDDEENDDDDDDEEEEENDDDDDDDQEDKDDDNEEAEDSDD